MSDLDEFENDPEFKEWFDSRPESIQAMIKANPPWFHYTLKTTGKECTLHSYSEDGTVTIDTEDTWGIEYSVFGIKPEDLIRGPLLELEDEEL